MVNFSGAKILSYNHTHEFLGEAFRFASKKELSVRGSIYNFSNTSGVSGIWAGISGLESGVVDYDSIILNSVNFGPGRINSLTFTEGNDVQKKDYTVGITVFDTGNMFNATGLYYSGLNFTGTGAPLNLVESFTENFDFNVSQDLKYTYKHDIKAKFVSGAANGTNGNPISMAQQFASGLLFSSPAFGFVDAQHSGFYTQPLGRPTFSEHYNLVTNECSFTKSLELDPISGNYSLRYSHDITTDENGITNVVENGTIKGLVSDYNASAESGYSTEIANAFGRCQSMFAFYLGGAGYPLVNAHIALSKKINLFNNEISYKVSYTNNPSANIGYIWEYTQSINLNPDNCFYTIKEKGKIRGVTDCTGENAYEKAMAAWATISAGMLATAEAFYTSATSLTNPLTMLAGGEGHNLFLGEIDYNYTYTDDPFDNVDGFKKIDYTVEDKSPVASVNKFNIINVKELVQSTAIAKEGIRSVTIKITGNRGTLLPAYVVEAQKILNSLIPNDPNITDIFISNCNYTFNPSENSFSLNFSWTFFAPWGFTQVLL